jgi:hypothetical protein
MQCLARLQRPPHGGRGKKNVFDIGFGMMIVKEGKSEYNIGAFRDAAISFVKSRIGIHI